MNQEAAASAAVLRQTNAAESAHHDVPQPLQAGAKKAAVASAVTPASKGIAAAPIKNTQFDVRAKTPSSTFLTGVGLEADEDELAKVSRLHRVMLAENTRN